MTPFLFASLVYFIKRFIDKNDELVTMVNEIRMDVAVLLEDRDAVKQLREEMGDIRSQLRLVKSRIAK